MGKKSTKENKNIFQLSREEKGLTRAEASESLEFVSESRIEKIESEKSTGTVLVDFFFCEKTSYRGSDGSFHSFQYLKPDKQKYYRI